MNPTTTPIHLDDFSQVKEQQQSFDHIAGMAGDGVTVGRPGHPHWMGGLYVSPDFFNIMPRQPLLGRLFTLIKHWADMAALWQDKQALFSVRPVRTEDAPHEVLMDFEPHIVAYRKMRRRLLDELADQSAENP